MADLTVSANVDTLMQAASFAAFRTSLGVAIGSDVQAFNSELTAFTTAASFTGTTLTMTLDGFLVQTATDTGCLFAQSTFASGATIPLVSIAAATGFTGSLLKATLNNVSKLDVDQTGKITSAATAISVGGFAITPGSALTTSGHTLVTNGVTYTLSGTASTIVSVDLTAAFSLTGGAGNMTITSGTGASRTLIFRTTTSGSVATTALTLAADQSATFAGNITGGGAITINSSGISTRSGSFGYFGASELALNEGTNIQVGTSTGTKIGIATGQKLGFWNADPVVQQVLATGGGKTVDNVITFLQLIGLCKQS